MDANLSLPPSAPPIETLPDGFEGYALVLEDGIFVKPGFFPRAGTIIPQHAHPFSHSTAVIRGAIEVFENGKFAGIVRARGGKSSFRTIKANVLHTFRTIEDGTEIWCLHNADRLDADGHLEPSELNSADRAALLDEGAA